jgi:autotransporter-associated beta strand protein
LTWTNLANWNSAAPGPLDTAVFDATSPVGAATIINNVVSLDQTVAALTYNQTTAGQWHVTQIPAATTLTVGGALTVGGVTVNSSVTSAALTGGGTLQVNGSLTVGNNATSGSLSGTILDLSGLSNFVFKNSAGNLQVSSGNRSGANMKFAAVSNHVTAANVNFNTLSTSGTTATGTVNLGAGTNLFNVATLFVTAYGRNTSTLQFPGATGGLRVRGLSGAETDRCPTYQVGYRGNFNSAGGGTSAGTNSFFGHPVDIKVGQLTVGRESVGGQTANTGPLSLGSGVLNFGPGILDATAIEVGRATSQGSQATAYGELNISTNGTLIMSGSGTFNLGYSPGTATTRGTANAFLNVTNGTVISSNSIIKNLTGGFGNVTNNISLIRSALTVAGGGLLGTAAFPLNSLTIGDSTLSLAVPLNSTNISVLAFNNVSTTNNTINLLSLPVISRYPTTYPILVSASGTLGTFALGTLPSASPAYQGYLTTTANTVALVLTNGPAPTVNILTWNGTPTGDWDTNSANWQGGLFYNPGDYLTFNDTLSGTTTVNLTTTLTPGSLTVTNTAKSYTFTGPGSIGGTAALNKSGTNKLVLANSVNHTFGGGVNIHGGTVQLAEYADLLPTNTTVALANVAGATLDLNGLNQTVGAVTGGGANGGNVSLGASGTNTLTLRAGGNYYGVIGGNGSVLKNNGGTETFYGANTYTGGTVIQSAILAVANANGSGTGPGPVTIGGGGQLQIGDGFAAGSVAAAIVTNDGTLTFLTTNHLTFTNQIVGAGFIVQGGNNTVTLPLDNAGFTGSVAINNGTLLVATANAIGTASGLTIGLNGSSCLALSNNISLNVPLQMYCKPSGSGPSVLNVSGTNTLPGNLNFSEGGVSWQFAAAAGRLIIAGSVNNTAGSGSRTLWLTGAGAGDWESNLGNGIGGSVTTDLLKDGPGTWTLGAHNYSYSGNTTVSNGTLLVNGTISGGAVKVRGGTLGGQGTMDVPVTVYSGGTLAPGASLGTLTVNSDLELAGTTVMELSVSGGVLANDRVNVAGILTLGGTLNVTLTGTVAGGDVFTLFTAGTFYYGSAFSTINLPALPAGYTWDTTRLAAEGILTVLGPPRLSVAQTGNGLSFSWAVGGFKLQSQTNALNVGITPNWHDYPNGGTSPVDVTIDPANPSVFFRLVSQ